MRIAINAAIIRNKRILLVKKKRVWILPGGKPEQGESDETCLSRELREELGVELVSPVFLTEVTGATPHTGDLIRARIYGAEIRGEPSPDAEILDFSWVRYGDVSHPLSEPTRRALRILNEWGHL